VTLSLYADRAAAAWKAWRSIGASVEHIRTLREGVAACEYVEAPSYTEGGRRCFYPLSASEWSWWVEEEEARLLGLKIIEVDQGGVEGSEGKSRTREEWKKAERGERVRTRGHPYEQRELEGELELQGHLRQHQRVPFHRHELVGGVCQKALVKGG